MCDVWEEFHKFFVFERPVAKARIVVVRVPPSSYEDDGNLFIVNVVSNSLEASEEHKGRYRITNWNLFTHRETDSDVEKRLLSGADVYKSLREIFLNII